MHEFYAVFAWFAWHFLPPLSYRFLFPLFISLFKGIYMEIYVYFPVSIICNVYIYYTHTYRHLNPLLDRLPVYRGVRPLCSVSLVYFTVDYIVVLTHCLISRECPRMGVAAAEHNYDEYYKRQIKTNKQFSIISNLWAIKL